MFRDRWRRWVDSLELLSQPLPKSGKRGRSLFRPRVVRLENRCLPSTISGRAFTDQNGSGVDSASNPGLGGVQVKFYLDTNGDGVLDNADSFLGSLPTTAGTGAYSVSGLPAGRYFVVGVTPAGYVRTLPSLYYIATVTSGDITGVDFGFFQQISVRGRVFNDRNGNGNDDGGTDPGLGGMTVNLYRDTNNDGVPDNGDTLVVSTTSLAGSGAYGFDNLGPGRYFIQQTPAAGYVQTKLPSSGYYQLIPTSGTNVTGADFGDFHLATITSRVFEDLNGDGSDNGGTDPGLGAVTVNLYQDSNHNGVLDGADALVASTTSAASTGTYSFTGLAPGAYFVQEAVPSGFKQTLGFPYYTATPQSGNTIVGAKFGDFRLGSASGRVFTDRNGDGSDDGGTDPGLGGATLFLYQDTNNNGVLDGGDTPVASTTSAAKTGAYSFSGLAPGTYFVYTGLPSGYARATVTQYYTLSVTTSGSTTKGLDFGAFQLGSAVGRVFTDVNGDGSDLATDPGLAGVTLNLYQDTDGNGVLDSADQKISSTTSASGTGTFSFTGLGPGLYFAQQSVPSGYTQTRPAAGFVYQFAVASGSNFAQLDFGDFQQTAVTGRVYTDRNGDGSDDGGTDPGLGGVALFLFQDINNNGVLDLGDTAVASTTSAASTGAYTFSGLGPGRFFVAQSLPAGYTQTQPPRYYQFVNTSGVNRVQVDFGNYQPAAVSGRVFEDQVGDGGDLASDPGLGDVTVKLYQDSNHDGLLDSGDQVLATTIADALTGAYTFTGLAPGTYFVQQVVPGAFRQTNPGTASYEKVVLTSGVGSAGNDFGDFQTEAILDVVGGVASYHASRGVANQLTLAQTGSTLNLSDAAEPIFLGPGALAAGFAGSETNTVQCTSGAISSIQMDTLDGNDRVTVASTSIPVTVAATGGGTDTVTIGGAGGAQGIRAQVSVSNTGGSTSLVVDDSGDLSTQKATLTAAGLTGLAPAAIAFGAGVGSVTIKGGSGGNQFTVANTPAVTGSIILYTGTGANTVNVQGTTGFLFVFTQGGSNQVVLSSQPSGSGGTLGGLGGGAAVYDLGSHLTDLVVDASGDTTGEQATLTANSITGLAPSSIYYLGLRSLKIRGGRGGNTFTLSDTAALAGGTSLFSGSGADTVNVQGTTGTLFIDGQGGQDRVLVGTQAPTDTSTVAGIQGAVTVTNSGGPLTNLIVDDLGDTTDRTATFTASTLTGLTPAPINYDPASLSGLTINLGHGSNTVNVLDTGSGFTTDLTAGLAPGTVNVQATTGALTIVGIGTLVHLGSAGSVQGLQGTVTVGTQGGLMRLFVDDSSDATGRSATLTASSLTGLAPATIDYVAASLAILDVFGGRGGNTFTVGDTANLTENTTLFCGTGNDTVAVEGNSGGLAINGEGGRDTVLIGSGGLLNTIGGGIAVGNPGGLTDVTVDDSLDTSSHTATLTDTSLTGLAPGTLVFTTGIGSLKILGGEGGNSFTVANTGAGPTSLLSGQGADTVTIQGTTGTFDVDGQNGADTVTIGNAGSVQAIHGMVSIHNTKSFSALTVDDSSDPVARNVTLSPNSVSGLAPAAINFVAGDLSSLTVMGGTGGNSFTVTDTAPFKQGTTLDSGKGIDKVTVLATTGTLTIDGQDGLDNVQVGSGGNAQGVRGIVTIRNSKLFSSVTVDDSGDTTGRTVTLNGTSLVGLTPAAIDFAPTDLAALTVRGGSGGNTFNIADTPGNTSLAVATVVDVGSARGAVSIHHVSGNLQVQVQDVRTTVTVGSQEHVTGFTGTIQVNRIAPNSKSTGSAGPHVATYYQVSPTTDGRLTAVLGAVSLLSRLALLRQDGGLLTESDGQASATPGAALVQDLEGGFSSDIYFLRVGALQTGTATFTLATTFAPAQLPFQPNGVNGLPYSVATGDFNGDGHLDLVATNSTGGSVNVLLGLGDGTFARQTAIAVGKDLRAGVAADFDRDKHLDLAVADYGNNDVAILMGRGDGTFQAPVMYAVGTQPTALVVGDFNGDGIQDLAVADYGSNDVTVLLGNKNGTFSPQKPIPVGSGPRALVAGYFTSSKHLDLAVANSGSNDVTVLLGNGNGTFQATLGLPVGFDPTGIVVGDFNGDGHVDLAAATDGVALLFGNGDGTFQSVVTVARGYDPSGLVAGDFNGDGHLDIAASSFFYSDDFVILGNGDGTFQAPHVYPVGQGPETLVAGDFNGDNNLDLATPNYLGATVSVLMGLGDGTFQGSTLQAVTGTTPQALVAADFNGDGHLDVVSAGRSRGSILLNRGSGSFDDPSSFATGAGVSSAATGDFNADGRQDLATANTSDNNVSVLLGIGDGTFQTAVVYSTGTAPAFVLAADFNGDGVLDLAVANSGSNDVSILLGSGDGTFRVQQRFAAGNKPMALAAGDFNGDGHLDLAVVDAGSNNVSVLFGIGDGTFQGPMSYAVGTAPLAVVADDFTGDKHPDLVVLNSGSSDVSFLVNSGKGTFLTQQRFFAGLQPDALVSTDLNGDGHPDLVVANGGGGSFQGVSVLLADGKGSFQSAVRYTVDGVPTSLAAGDFNGDGHIDIAVGGQFPNTVSVLLGTGTGTFLATNNLSSPAPFTPVVADLNGDGTNDLLIRNASGEILLRKGHPGQPGIFDSPVVINRGFASLDFAVVSGPQGKRVASLDVQGNTISLFTPLADGSFARSVLPLNGVLPSRIGAADLNGDGLDDLAVLDRGSQAVTVFLANPDGTFSPQLPLPVGYEPSELVLADTTGSGRKDILVTSQLGGDVRILRSLGGGNFAPAFLDYRAGAGPYGLVSDSNNAAQVRSQEQTSGLAVGTFFRGLPPQLVAANRGSNTLALLLNQGGGSFLNPLTFPGGSQPTVIQTADLNNDGNLDVVALDEGSNTISVILGDGKGGFIRKTVLDAQGHSVPLSAGDQPTGLTVYDFNGDGIPDLLVGNNSGDVLVLLGNGDGTFRPYQRTDRNIALAVGDLQGNGQDGFIYGDQARDEVAVQQNQESPNTILADRQQGLRAPGSVQLVDLNGDNIPDLVVANSGSNNVLVYQGLGNGQFGPAHSFFAGTNPVGITVANLSSNPIPDLIVANEGSNDVSILLGQGTGANWTLTPGPRLKVGQGPVATALATVDGQQQLVVTNSQSNDVWMLPSRGNGFFSDQPGAIQKFAVGSDPQQSFVGAFRGPGTQVLVTLDAGSNDLTVYASLNPASPHTEISSAGLFPVAAVERDFNGVAGLIVANEGDGVVALFTGGPDGLSLDQALESPGGHPTALAESPDNSDPGLIYVADAGNESAAALHFTLENGIPVPVTPPPFEGGPSLTATLTSLADTPLAVVPVVGPADGFLARVDTTGPAVPGEEVVLTVAFEVETTTGTGTGETTSTAAVDSATTSGGDEYVVYVETSGASGADGGTNGPGNILLPPEGPVGPPAPGDSNTDPDDPGTPAIKEPMDPETPTQQISTVLNRANSVSGCTFATIRRRARSDGAVIHLEASPSSGISERISAARTQVWAGTARRELSEDAFWLGLSGEPGEGAESREAFSVLPFGAIPFGFAAADEPGRRLEQALGAALMACGASLPRSPTPRGLTPAVPRTRRRRRGSR